MATMLTTASSILEALLILGMAAVGVISFADPSGGSARGWIYILSAVVAAAAIFHLW
jgi:hypothetical protein